MWTALAFVYVLGAFVTALSVVRNQVFTGGHLLSTGAAILWPAYWSFLLATLLRNRASRDLRRPSK